MLHVGWLGAVIAGTSSPQKKARAHVLLSTLSRARQQGCRIAWTPPIIPEDPEVRGLLAKVAELSDVIIVNSSTEGENIVRAFPRIGPDRLRRVDYGNLIDCFADISTQFARECLVFSEREPVFLLYGPEIDERTLELLLQIHSASNSQDRLRLDVVGRPASAKIGETLKTVAASTPTFRYERRPICRREVTMHFSAADAVCLLPGQKERTVPLLLSMSQGRSLLLPEDLQVPRLFSGKIQSVRYQRASGKALYGLFRLLSSDRGNLHRQGTRNLKLARQLSWTELLDCVIQLSRHPIGRL